MEEKRPTLLRLYVGLTVFSLAGSMLSSRLNLDPGFIAPLCSFCLLVLGVGLLALRAGTSALLLVPIIGGVSEICGIYTGFPFGRYTYTGNWWPSVTLPGGHFFPLLLPFAWAKIVLACIQLTPHEWPVAGRIAATATLAATVDLFMEPVMVWQLRYWSWIPADGPLPGGAPYQNFIGWWLVSALAAAATLRSSVKPDRRTAAIVLGAYVALIIGFGLIGQLGTNPAQTR